MSRRTVKDINAAKPETIEKADAISEQKEDTTVVDLEKNTEEQKEDVSDVVSQDETAQNIEAESIPEPENTYNVEKVNNEAEMLNEDAQSDETDSETTVDEPEISVLIDPSYVVETNKEPISAYVSATPVYIAQCPPKPATVKSNAYVAQRPY